MGDSESRGGNNPDLRRPWEEEKRSGDNVVEFRSGEEGSPEPEEPVEMEDEEDEELAAYTSEVYLSATTQEYQGLAEEVIRASEEEWEPQAVAATFAGVGSGLVSFDDVSGRMTEPEEAYEAAEQAATSDLAMRIGSAVVIFGLFLGSLLLGGWWFTAFVILVMVVAVGELYATLRTQGYRPLALFGLLGVILIGVGVHGAGPGAVAGWAGAAAAATILFFSLTQRRMPLENAAVTILGVAWVGMLAFAIPIAQGPRPVAYIFFLVLVVACNDIGAYFVGRAFGSRPLASRLSPSKTVEGFFGGLVLGAVAASVLSTFPAWEAIGITKALVVAGVVGLLAPLGDLSQSVVKRSMGVKDMGSVLPGHGGMLDRIDGFLFAVPAVYFVFRAFQLL